MDKHEPDMPYFDILGRAQAAVFPNEELKAENFNLVNTEGFEKAVVLLKCWADRNIQKFNITFFNTECSGLKTLFEVWTGKSVVFYTVNQSGFFIK